MKQPMKENNHLQNRVEKQVRRKQKADAERPHLLSQTIFIGTLGLMLVLPVIAGAYLGHWLDSQSAGYSVRWTLGMILLGVIIGTVNVYLFIKERE
jgi:ATP synthase protein I